MTDELGLATLAGIIIGGVCSGLAVFHYFRTLTRHVRSHLRSCWNVLATYRSEMPEEPQPMDHAMANLMSALLELGETPPTGDFRVGPPERKAE